MPTPEDPTPGQSWSVSRRNSSPPSAPAEIDLFSMASPNSNGYEKWLAEKQARRHEFELTWGIRLGCRVHVQLRNERNTREGVIQLVDDLPCQPAPHERPRLHLRIGDYRFLPNQIESLAVID